MKKRPTPPRWADRFLSWYCNPELLEEIQGDAHELYYERLQTEGRRAADFKYIWDVIRFCRMSNVKRTAEYNEPGFFSTFWNLNLKIAIRNSIRNKMVFTVKLSALAICLAFTFLLTGFVINELSYDHHYENYDRIYRIGSRAEMQGKLTSFAVSPMPTASALIDEVPGIKRSSKFTLTQMMLEVDDRKFYGIQTYNVDTSFLRMFKQDFIHGTESALDEPARIVLTESVAKRIFGESDVVGKTVTAGQTEFEIGAVIKDLPGNTHFTFECLVSESTFRRVEVWDDINAYTYVELMPGVEMAELDTTIASVIDDYLDLISEEYDFKYQPVIQRIDEIHLEGYLDEDFAPKRSRNYVYIIMSVIVLFLLTGLFNYLNLALAELTTQIKKIAVLRTFGGISADHRRVALTDVFLCLLIVAPVVVLIMVLMLSYPGFLPVIDSGVWWSTPFLTFTAALLFVIIVCSTLNSLVISRTEIVLSAKASGTQNGFTARKILVAAQLSFSIIMIGLILVIFDQFRFVNDGDKGFDDSDVLVITRLGQYKEVQALQESIRKMSGVKMVAGTSFYPDGAVETKDIFSIELADGMKNQLVNFIYGDVDYPRLLDLKLVDGRFFDENFSTDAKGAYLINQTAAKEFGWANPIGKRIEGPMNADGRAGEVIGVVEDFHFESMHTRIQPVIIFLGDDSWRANFLYVKTEPLVSSALVENIERAYRKVFPDLPFDYGYLDARYRGLYKHDYEIRDIFRWGLIVSIVVSGLGIFSISALMLSLRTKEMGIRKVVGAENSDLFLRHLKPFAIFFATALVIGLPVVFYLADRWLNNFAYHITFNMQYFLMPAIVTVIIILGASVYHAVRSARVNPAEILKSE